MMRIVVLVFLIVCSPVAGLAATYYVDSTLPGSDSNDGLSEGAPFLTIPKCITVVVSGDTCLVKNGTYTISGSPWQVSPTKSGTFSSPTTFKNYPGHTPRITSTGKTNTLNQLIFGTSNSNTINYIVFEGFEIDNLYSLKCYNCYRSIFRKTKVHDMQFGSWSGTFSESTIEENLSYTNGRFTECGTTPSICNKDQGFYITGTSNTIRNNIIYNQLAYGIQVQSEAFTSQHASIAFSNATGNIVEHNTIAYTAHRGGIVFSVNSGGTCGSNTAQNNLILEYSENYGGSGYIDFAGCGTGNIVRNNHYFGGSGAGIVGGTPGVTYTATNNTSGTNPNLVNAPGTLPASPDFRLTSSSTAVIDAGYVTGTYNGSAPDIGAFETFIYASCAVEAATPTVVNITFQNNVNPPLLITDDTGLSARETAVLKTNDSAAINGTNQVDLTVTAAFSAATSIDISASGTNITDSALIGGTFNQPYIQTLTNQACANNVSGGVSYTWTQSRYGFYALRGTEAGISKLPASGSADNTNKTVMVGGAIGIRIKMNCTGADCPADGFILRYSKNGGAYTIVPDAFAADNIAFYTANDSDVVAQGSSTTERLTSDYATNVTGSVTRTANAIPSVDLSQDSEIELLYFVHLDTDATAGDTYAFRLYRQGGDTITYSQTPTLTVVPVSAGGGP